LKFPIGEFSIATGKRPAQKSAKDHVAVMKIGPLKARN